MSDPVPPAATDAAKGLDHEPQKPSAAKKTDITAPGEMMNFLQDLFSSHGAEVKREGDWISVDHGKLLVLVKHYPIHDGPGSPIRGDYVAKLPSGLEIQEAFVGTGSDLHEALSQLCQLFAEGAFHPWFKVLLKRDCAHADVVHWTIGGRPRQVTVGLLLTRGPFPQDQWQGVLDGMLKNLETFELSPGLHWMRYYHGFQKISGTDVCEVLVDNETSDKLEALSHKLPWPKTELFTSARLFFMIEDGKAEDAAEN